MWQSDTWQSDKWQSDNENWRWHRYGESAEHRRPEGSPVHATDIASNYRDPLLSLVNVPAGVA